MSRQGTEFLEDRLLLTTILFEDFEDSTVTYTANPADDLSDIANLDYYGRIAPDTSTPPASISYSTPQGSGYYGAKDTDGVPGAGSTSVVQLDWSGISVASFTNLELSWFVAEDDATDGNEDWDQTTSFRIAVQADGGGFNDVFAIESESNTGGNTAPRVDTNFDGLGDGTEITDTFTQFSANLADATTIDIRVVIEDLDTSDEDIALDNLLLTGDTVSAPVLSSFQRQNPTSENTNADSLTFRATFSEDVQNVTTGDFTANGTTAIVTGVSADSPSVYDITVSGGDLASVNGTVGIDLAAGQDITDLDSNALPSGEPGVDETYDLDNIAPATVSFERQDPTSNPTDADTLLFRVTFSEDVENVDLADFAANGTTATPTSMVVISPSVYDVRVSGGDLAALNGTVGLDLAAGQDIADAAGNALPGTEPATDETFTIDNTGSPTTVLLEDFEDATLTYVTNEADDLSDIANQNYFGRIDSTSGLPADISYLNPQGAGFYGAHDTDGTPSGNIDLITLNWTGVDITGFTDLNLSWFVAEDVAGSGLPSWDETTSVRLEVQIDAGGFNPIFAIEAEAAGNTAPRVDTNFDGTGDGAAITDTFTQFSSAIASGTVLDIRLTIEDLDTSNEDIAFDNLFLTGEIDSPPTLLSFERQTPGGANTNADTLTFRATFDEDVQNVDITDFAATGTTAMVSGVVVVDASTYDITISGGNLADLDGTVGLDLAVGQNITDLASQALPNTEPTTDETYSVDNTAPVAVSFVRQTPTGERTNADTLTFRATFSEDVLSVSLNDFAATGTTGTVTSGVGVDSATFDLVVSGGDLAGLNGIVGLDLAAAQNITDAAGNVVELTEPATDETFFVDNAAPSVLSFVRQTPSDADTNADSLVFRATFGEDVTDVDAADFVVSGTTADVTTVSPVTGSVFDVTVSGGDLAGLNGTVGLDLAAGQDIADVAGNALPAGEPTTDETYIVDNTAPVLQAFARNTPGNADTNADTLVFDITFSEDVTNIAASDFEIAGTTADGVLAGGGSNYTLTVSGGDLADLEGTVGVDLAAAQGITDAAGNALPAGEPATDETYELDNTAPIAVSFVRQTPTDELTNADTLTFRATFSEAVLSVSLDDFAATGTTGTVTSGVGVDSTTFDLVVTGGDLASFNGVVGLDLSAIQDMTDAAGNPVTATEPATDETFTLDNMAPTVVSFARQTPVDELTNADSLTFRVTFDEELANVDAVDFTANGTTGSVSAVSIVDASTYDVTVSGGNLANLNGTVGIDLAGVQDITDLAGNALPAGEPATDESYMLDNTAPILTSFTRQDPTDENTNADELTFRATFDEPVANVGTDDFAANGTTATTTAVVMVDATTFDITISGGDLASLNGVVGLDLAVGQDITDAAGNMLPAAEPATDETYDVQNEGVQVDGNMLLIFAGGIDNTIVVREQRFNFKIFFNGEFLPRVDKAGITQIKITTADGNDTTIVYLRNAFDLQISAGAGDDLAITNNWGVTTTHAGEGADTVIGGRGQDIMYGEGGNDTLRGRIGNDVIDGGIGADDIRGGVNHDILIGGEGDDSLKGDQGRDLVIGGLGSDDVRGGLGRDILIGSRTTYDDDIASLQTIHDIWRSPGAPRDHRDTIQASATPLTPGTHVIDDTAPDTLTGGSGVDWFFGAVDDVLRGSIDLFDQI